ncbi:hypothetical protein BGZ76_009033 [Entomortierella beljakovae]|nr:hypothetical protein BGZ76_009033 [Entomortierella beljakovae]
MTPSRLVAAYNAVNPHRFTQWMLTRPYSMMHMRLLFLTQQLLITNLPNVTSPNNNGSLNNSHGIPTTPTLVSLDASTCQLHTSASIQGQCQPQQEEIISPHSQHQHHHHAAATTTEGGDSTPSLSAVSDNTISFNYLLAASWHPKTRQRQPTHQQVKEDIANAERTLRWKQKLRAAHPGKVDAGEDAFFHVSTPSRVALGVADGVGGWSELGVDPALFSWALMNNAEQIACLTDSVPDTVDTLSAGTERKILDAQTILDGAYSELVESGKIEAGSSTACILSLCKLTGTLKASNLGDSAFLLIRDKKCIYESPSQQHFWNCPYQLTVLPPKLRQQQDVINNIENVGELQQHNKPDTMSPKPKKKKYVQDLPQDAVQTTHQLQDGDVIVLATDGFWDNVFTKEAIELVDRELGDIIRDAVGDPTKETHDSMATLSADDILSRVRALSKRLTNTARRFSLDSNRMTPFSQNARHLKCGGEDGDAETNEVEEDEDEEGDEKLKSISETEFTFLERPLGRLSSKDLNGLAIRTKNPAIPPMISPM